jgi:DNA-binding NarL/FixJ family response regulator
MIDRIRLLITDDHPVVRAGLQGMLASQPDFEIVGEATHGAEAIALAERLQPQVILMDLRMPDMDGAEATRQIKAKYPHLHVLVLTTYEGDADILRAIEAGATGYLLKDAPREDLYRAIRAAAKGESALTPAIARRIMQAMRTPPPAAETLSARETEVLGRVAKGASNKEIARDLHISEATVKSHLLHIFGKLGVDDRTAAVTAAMKRGWLKLDDSSLG